MRILHFTHSPPDYIPPPPLSTDQVVAGPRYPDLTRGGRVVSIGTPMGELDAAAVLERLSPGWRPDLVVVRTDAMAECRPVNISVFGCPAVLLVGDTHHRRRAISGVMTYAGSEPFAATCLDYTRQHAHFLVESGLSNVAWMPGLNVARMDVHADNGFQHRLTMVGQVHAVHVRRGQTCRGMLQAGLPLQVLQSSNEDSRRLHALSQVSLNCSLNGDLNLRVLEVLQVGGALLTDRLAPEAGLELLAEPGTHLHTYASTAEAVELARGMLKDVDRCRAMGAAARAHYENIVAPEIMARHFLTLARGGEVPSLLDVRQDARVKLIDTSADPSRLQDRVAAYEVMQYLHQRSERLIARATPSVDGRMLADLVDLPRLRLRRDPGAEWPGAEGLRRRADDLLVRAELDSRVPVSDPNDAETVDVVLAASGDESSDHLRAVLSRHPVAKLVPVGSVDARQVASMGLEPDPDTPGAWRRPARKPPTRPKRR